MFLLNSRLGLFTAAPLRGHPFFRSYGANLPSSLTWFLSRTLVYSTIPPVSVCGTDAMASTLRSFSWQRSITCTLRWLALDLCRRICQSGDLRELDLNPMRGQASFLRPSFTPSQRCRNVRLLSITYAFRPRLRVRLTPGGRPWPGKPWNFGDRDSYPVSRYSCLHGHLSAVQRGSPLTFSPACNALLPRHCCHPRRRL